MLNGYLNKVIRVNLKTKNINIEPLPHIKDLLIGGKGLGAWYLNRELKPGIDPIGESNKLFIMTGPLQGSIIPICGRYTIVTKSPLTGLFLDSHGGGFIGSELRFAGFDALIIEGKSSKACYISIIDHDIRIHNADHLKGKTTLDKEIKIKEEIGEGLKIMSIGLAGENMVKYACVVSDSFRNIGRGGIGAVFGSKNLLAIAIKGSSKKIPFSYPEKMKDLAQKLNDRAKQGRKSGLKLYKIGTPNLVTVASNREQIPIRNFQRGKLDNLDVLGEQALINFPTQKKPCYNCPISCAHVYKDKYLFGKSNHILGGMEYETLGMVGANAEVNMNTVMEINYLANTYGLDTISLGNVIAFFMECSEKNLVPLEYEAEKIIFGDKKGIIELVHKIANKEGVGAILAEGVKKTAELFGKGTNKFAIHVKGLEMAAWDPRGRLALGLSYATAAVGASHLRGWPPTTKLPKDQPVDTKVVEGLVKEQDLKMIKDSLIICHFTHSIIPALSLEDCQYLLEASTGSTTNIREVAQNIWSLTRYFNMKEFALKNIDARDFDDLPYRLLYEPLPVNQSKAFISKNDFENGLQILYRMRKCQENGNLLPEEITQIESILK